MSDVDLNKINTNHKKTKKITNFVPLLVILIVIILFRIADVISKRTVPNTAGVSGNTTCNLYNGGVFCLSDGIIYFDNPLDRECLYSVDSKTLSKFKKVSNERCGCLNATTKYLVYARQNYLRDEGGKAIFDYTASGLFRINKKGGKNIKMFYDDPVAMVTLYGNDIYYQHYDDGNISLYHCNLDGTENHLIVDNPIVPGTVSHEGIIFAGAEKDHYIYRLNPVNGESIEVYEGNCYLPAYVGDSIYFMSLSNNYAIARVDSHGGSPTLLTRNRCSAYNVTPDERYLIYQVDDGENNRLEVMDLYSVETTTVAYGNFNCIHVLGDRVFFRSFDEDRIFYFELSDLTIKEMIPLVFDK